MIVVTGGAGFIGSNVVTALAARGVGGGESIAVVDRLGDPRKHANLLHAPIADYWDRDDFLAAVESGSRRLDDVSLVVHQGACSSTTHPDPRHVMTVNHAYTMTLVRWCVGRGVPIVYASSAAVYGAADEFVEDPRNERPANVYGWSKLLVDRGVRLLPPGGSQVVGLRYFNVYGPGEAHKDEMASIVAQLHAEAAASGTVTVFGASHGLGPGEQRRDFVSVHDVVDVVCWFVEHPERSGIFNVGTGASRTFGEVAAMVAAHTGADVRFRDFPEALVDRYQPVTCADLGRLRDAGYDREFTPVEVGVPEYLRRLDG